MTRRIFTDTPAAHVVDHYAHAREKHPYFCDAITTFSDPYDEVIALDKARSAVRREIAQGKLLPMTLLNCAWLEAIQHYLTGNSTGAVEHLYDAISVLLRTIDVIEGRQPLGDPAPKMTWDDFAKKHNFRQTERCCATCKHGAEDYEGECGCKHPLLRDNPLAGRRIDDVCDLWEAAPTSPRFPHVPRAMRNPRHTCRACGKPVADGNMRFRTACWIARKRGNFIAQRKERTQCCR